MPTYELRCKKCDHSYEILSSMGDREENVKKAKCVECGSKSKEQLISCPNFNFANPVGTDRWNSDSKGHDYRYKYNAPNVAAQREAAEKNSHVGPTPYHEIDDITSGKHFGEVE